MLRATFQNLVRGIDAERETALWKRGVLSWDDFENLHPLQESLFPETIGTSSPFFASRNALYAGDIAFFAKALNPREYFRIPLEFPDKTLFLDIETTGLSRYYDIITLVGWCYRGRYRTLIQG